ncbi:hypothetical protein BDV96DRAFT_60925 [Lophiotrema nucula]|uniref:Uncharacterized protein n=1 Tax=Lophiotrema nucula TaxID=690887 RepID=A0A6A5Z9G3_9PLEO|nr:hypothetical protein BDV96DRAFT_60925 [Lophiotrema nucula]
MPVTRSYWRQTSATRSGRCYNMERSTKALKKSTSIIAPPLLLSVEEMGSMGQVPPLQLKAKGARSGVSTRRIVSSSNQAQRDPTRLTASSTQHSETAQQRSGLSMQDFVLYQANQVVSDAMVVKRFVATALDPTKLRLKATLDDHSAITSTIETYLFEVNLEVSNMMDRMIRDAHCKALEILSKDDNQPLPFFNVDLIQGADFKEFKPGCTLDATAGMRDWYCMVSRESMVQYRRADYNIKDNLAICKKLRAAKRRCQVPDDINMLPRGRVLPLLSPKKQKSRAALAEVPMSQPDVTSNSTAGFASNTPHASVALTDKPHGPQLHGMEKLLDHHNELLNRAKLRSSRFNSFTTQEHGASLDTMTVIAQAIEDGKLNPPSKEVQSQMDEYMLRRKGVVPDVTRLSAAERDGQAQADTPGDGMNEIALADALLAAIYSDEERMRKNNAEREAFIIEEVGRRKEHSKRQRPRQSGAKKQKLADGSAHRRDCATPSRKKKTKRPDGIEPEAKRQEANRGPTYRKRRRGKATLGPQPLEPGQQLPDSAYREPQEEGEQFAWRCGIKHALGYYYLAGDRKHCLGCGTHFRAMNSYRIMDFYLPPKSWVFQNAPQDVIWTPSSPSKEPRKGAPASHNAIAKDAYWAAVRKGATKETARRIGAQAVLDHFEAKRKAKIPPTPEPSPEPEPTPEPVILPPHPSGSQTMEHGQEIPDCYRWEKEREGEEFAWRCDGNHALGRYYMAGDKKTCPGCGSNRKGPSKKQTMDFYLPFGIAVRQTSDGLTHWKPRKPYNIKNSTQDNEDKQICSHNQRAARYYWEMRDKGTEHVEALTRAIEMTEEFLDKEEDAWVARQAKREAKKTYKSKANVRDSDTEMEDADDDESNIERKKDPTKASNHSVVDKQTLVTGDRSERNEDGGVIISLIAKKRGHDEVDSDTEEYDHFFEDEPTLAAPPVDSSSDEDISDSDSE